MIDLLNMDCMDYLRECEDNAFDLAIVDPPYGLDRFKSGGSHLNKYGSEFGAWNNEKPSDEYFNELFRISKNQIIWGGNNFQLPTSEYFIVWQKGAALDFSFAMVEQAWTNIKKPAKLLKCLQVETQGNTYRIHPTQKPVKLYAWLLSNYAKEGDRILDTHLGSGSSAIAAHYGQFDFVGIEIDEDYYKAACERFEKETAQLDLLA